MQQGHTRINKNLNVAVAWFTWRVTKLRREVASLVAVGVQVQVKFTVSVRKLAARGRGGVGSLQAQGPGSWAQGSVIRLIFARTAGLLTGCPGEICR